MIVKITQEDRVVFSGHPADAKEYVQDMFEEKYNIYPDLQENDEDGEYQLYLHSDAYDDLTEKEILLLDQLQVTEDSNTTTVLEGLLNISFQVIE